VISKLYHPLLPFNEDKIREEFQVIDDTIVSMKYIDLKKNITFQYGVVGLPVEIKGIEVIDTNSALIP
jgi:hypothetical protein